MKCCHPKCPGKAYFAAKVGETTWMICEKCRMTFPATDKRRKR